MILEKVLVKLKLMVLIFLETSIPNCQIAPNYMSLEVGIIEIPTPMLLLEMMVKEW